MDDTWERLMDKFDVICPDHYPMKCNLSPADKDYLLSQEKLKAFFIFQYQEQDEWLEPIIERYFSERTWRLFNAGKEGGTGTKFCNICRYALASDFGIVSLTPLNYNVFQEIGLMQGLQKPLIYVLNQNRKEKLPFDIDDQIYVQHTDGSSLYAGLDKKIPLIINKVKLLSGFESAQREHVKELVNQLSPEAKKLTQRLLIEGEFRLTVEDLTRLVTKKMGLQGGCINELSNARILVDELESGGSKTLQYRKINPSYRKYLEEILWE